MDRYVDEYVRSAYLCGPQGRATSSSQLSDNTGGFFQELKRRKVVNSAAWYLGVAFVAMQVVDDVFPYAGLPDMAGTVVLIALVCGFPVAMGLSWVLKVTPPNFRRELPREVAVAAEALARAPQELRTDSLAVLPFDNLSDDPANAYFGDGITDDIISSVAHIKGLRVLSRASTMQFKGLNPTAAEIASTLGVATVVGGSVRRSGSRVRVMAEVIDLRTDDHVWTDTYDREIEDIFVVQSEIAASIAHAVQRELSSVDRRRIEIRGTRDPESYDLYLRGRFLWNQRSETSVLESVRYFDRALERDGRFALAYSALADAHTILGVYGLCEPREAFETAAEKASAALAIEPALGEAITVHACVRAIYSWDWTGAEELFERAIEHAPSYSTAHQWYATNLLVPLRRPSDARRQLARARELDPTSSAIAVSEALVTFYEGDFRAAALEFERILTVHPRFALVPLFLGQCLHLTGDAPRARELLRQAVELSDDSSEALAALGYVLAQSGDGAGAEAILRRLQDRARRTYVSPALVAQVLAGLNRMEEALDQLEAAADVRATDLIWMGVRPAYDSLRKTERFLAVQARVGVA